MDPTRPIRVVTVPEIPWPPTPACRCGAGLYRVMLRDRLGAEMTCAECGRIQCVWFTQLETEAIDAVITAHLAGRCCLAGYV